MPAAKNSVQAWFQSSSIGSTLVIPSVRSKQNIPMCYAFGAHELSLRQIQSVKLIRKYRALSPPEDMPHGVQALVEDLYDEHVLTQNR